MPVPDSGAPRSPWRDSPSRLRRSWQPGPGACPDPSPDSSAGSWGDGRDSSCSHRASLRSDASPRIRTCSRC